MLQMLDDYCLASDELVCAPYSGVLFQNTPAEEKEEICNILYIVIEALNI
jgi:hypothetical protein